MYKFNYRRILGIFVRTDNLQCHAGSVCLFSKDGYAVYHYIQEAGTPEWAIRRVWAFFFFGILHVSEGKSTSVNGWHLLLPRIDFKLRSNGFHFYWNGIDRYGSVKRTRLQRIKEYYRVRRLRNL